MVPNAAGPAPSGTFGAAPVPQAAPGDQPQDQPAPHGAPVPQDAGEWRLGEEWFNCDEGDDNDFDVPWPKFEEELKAMRHTS